MDTAFRIEAVEDAMARFGEPESFNTRQRSQFTSREFTALLIAVDIRISMDGNGAWRDDVFVERLWKSVKCEELCPARLCQRVGGPCLDRPASRVLHRTNASSGLGMADARPGFLQRAAANPAAA